MKRQGSSNIQEEESILTQKSKVLIDENQQAHIQKSPQKQISPSFVTVMKKLINQQRFTEVVYRTKKNNPELYKEFKYLKLKGVIYQIGDILSISNASDLANDFVGKLLRIIKINLESALILVELQWYYKKQELPKTDRFNKILDTLSNNELFFTEHRDLVLADSINGFCKLFTYEEYDNLQSVFNNFYFSRANFNVKTKKFEPPYEQWKVGCICKKPLNPDLVYINCDSCQKWFHLTCANVKESVPEQTQKYLCPQCSSLQVKTELQSNCNQSTDDANSTEIQSSNQKSQQQQ